MRFLMNRNGGFFFTADDHESLLAALPWRGNVGEQFLRGLLK